ncbi:MAG: transketolase family protein [Lachnospiraceae bacterium]|jgi:transketolase|nr:transketolase family protein [Lachnospiraceae bacterium]
MAETKKIATRESYGHALEELGAENPNIVVLDADLKESTRTSYFAKKFPERFFDCGIAEGNMMTVAAGLATCGKIPFASTFAMFASGRAYEQVRNSIGYPHLNVKIGATHAGITVGEDGASHQCLEDISLMRGIPGMVVLSPADDVEARACVRAAAAHEGPVYMRFGRYAVPVVFDEDLKFEIGKGRILRPGHDVTIVATGICVAGALDAAAALAGEGIDAEVIDICTIKPIDEDLLVASAAKTGKVVTCEEHWITGGLGSAVAEVLSEKCPTRMRRIGMKDRFGESGTAAELVAKYGLDGAGIAAVTREFIQS